MNTVYSIIIEMCLLGFLALLYYFYQKKKILRNAEEQRAYLRGQISFLLAEELKIKENLQIRKYLQVLENHSDLRIELSDPSILSSEIQELINDFNAL